MLVERIRKFLKDKLVLELSKEKTRITNASNDQANFLSVGIKKGAHTTYTIKRNVLTRNVKNVRLTASLRRVTTKLAKAGFIKNEAPYPKFA
jgi:hypothetical protein